jgi:uncharacterized protein (TIGR00251 family)
MSLVETVQGVVLRVYVKSKAKENRLELDENNLIVSCRESQVKGKVNKGLTQKFSRLFCQKVELVSGFTSHKKKFLVHNIKAEDAKKILVSSVDSW